MTTDKLATLVAYDCWRLLEGAEIARVAWRSDDEIELIPVNYGVADGALWFRTEADSALAHAVAGQPLVVEVDQVDHETHASWSVVLRGTAEVVDVLDAPEMVVEMRVWPAGTRSVFVRVEPLTLTGRRLWGTRPTEGAS